MIPGLCCLVACTTQLQRVVMCFEIRWINTHRVVPNHDISYLTSCMLCKCSSFQLHCVSTLCMSTCCHACGQIFQTFPSVSHFCILHCYDERLVETCALTSQELLLLTTKVYFSKNSSMNSKQAASLLQM